MLSPYTVLDLTDDRGELAAMILGRPGSRRNQGRAAPGLDEPEDGALLA